MEYEDQGEISKTVAVVRPFVTDDNMPAFPWDLWALDLGVQVWHGDTLGDLQVVEIELVSGQLILIPITISGVEYWVTIAHNHDGTEVDMDVNLELNDVEQYSSRH
ncbi:hypothetical protein BDR04DRAFT_1164102 [Suillus decipiens]|nr:hypothetical protein BDR04DRAFT_1164102 [Suillus decipiens]